MNPSPESQWNERYQAEEFAYGIEPNVFFKEQIDLLEPGKALFVAEGEGRNAVYAGKTGWKSSAFDISIEGKKKADRLAEKSGIQLDYRVGALPELGFEAATFDLIVFIYSHIGPEIRSEYHQLLTKLLKPGGRIIVEGFAKKHLEYRAKNPAVGGPPVEPFLFSLEEFQRDFSDFNWNLAEETEVELREGLFHRGTGWVLRMVGEKSA